MISEGGPHKRPRGDPFRWARSAPQLMLSAVVGARVMWGGRAGLEGGVVVKDAEAVEPGDGVELFRSRIGGLALGQLHGLQCVHALQVGPRCGESGA